MSDYMDVRVHCNDVKNTKLNPENEPRLTYTTL